MSKMKYIATLSGGKDSTVMCDLLLKNNYPVDYIVFNDTLHEFDEMYLYVKRVNEYFKSRYKKEIIFLKPTKTLEDMVFGKISDRKGSTRAGQIRGLPMPIGYPCWWRREAKNYPFDKWLKDNNIKEHKIYIGFTMDEPNRKMQGDNFLYPLINDFKMSETDCHQYLINQEMENPLYKHFTRTGCSFCPAQSDRSFYQVWKHYPNEWEYMKNIEKKLFDLEKQGETIQNKYWFNGRKTCAEMEKKFKTIDNQGSLFDFSNEPLADCFCKI